MSRSRDGRKSRPANPTAKPKARRKQLASKAKPADARPRRSLMSRLKPKRVLAAGLALGLLGSGLWAWQSGYTARQFDQALDGLVALSGDMGITVGSVQVLGRERTSGEAILSALDVRQGAPLLAFDPHAARQRLETLPWVRNAAVERRLPNLILVTLEEREAAALWQLGGRLQVVDSDGRIIDEADPRLFGNLPLLVGPGAPEHSGEFFRILAAAPELQSRVVAAVRVGDRRWNVRLMPGIDVRLPEEGAAEAWQRLARLDREQGLLSRDLVVIDLRTPDRLVVRPAPGVVVPPPELSDQGEET